MGKSNRWRGGRGSRNPARLVGLCAGSRIPSKGSRVPAERKQDARFEIDIPSMLFFTRCVGWIPDGGRGSPAAGPPADRDPASHRSPAVRGPAASGSGSPGSGGIGACGVGVLRSGSGGIGSGGIGALQSGVRRYRACGVGVLQSGSGGIGSGSVGVRRYRGLAVRGPAASGSGGVGVWPPGLVVLVVREFGAGAGAVWAGRVPGVGLGRGFWGPGW